MGDVDERRPEKSFHEAGHCVSAVVLSIPIKSIRMVPDESGKTVWWSLRSSPMGVTTQQWPLLGSMSMPELPCAKGSVAQNRSLPVRAMGRVEHTPSTNAPIPKSVARSADRVNRVRAFSGAGEKSAGKGRKRARGGDRAGSPRPGAENRIVWKCLALLGILRGAGTGAPREGQSVGQASVHSNVPARVMWPPGEFLSYLAATRSPAGT